MDSYTAIKNNVGSFLNVNIKCTIAIFKNCDKLYKTMLNILTFCKCTVQGIKCVHSVV